VSAEVEERECYLADFERFSKSAGRNGDSWLFGVRQAAMDSFSTRGFPSTKEEEWKYTNVEAIRRLELRVPATVPTLAGAQTDAFSVGDWECEQLTFLNGHLEPRESAIQNGTDIYVGGLAEAITQHRDWVEPHLAHHADYREHAFKALNTAFMMDGGAVYFARDRCSDKPVHLRFLPAVHDSQSTIIHPRNLIVVDDNSSLALVESYGGTGQAVYCTNAVTEIVLGENAVVEHYRLQLEPSQAFHLGTVQVYQGRNSTYRSVLISAGAGLARIEVNVVLDGDGGRTELNGLYSAMHKMHVDCRTRVEHRKPHTSSRELYKGILGGHSRGIFNGRVIVSKDAQKTDAQQSNRNLLLSKDAEVDSKPQLEIFADDVRCSHGTTIGQLEEEELFYLRSRGLGVMEARQLLIHGFAGEILDSVRIEGLRTHLERTIHSERSTNNAG
jgi:Fe-S cluster assembly protein SufD